MDVTDPDPSLIPVLAPALEHLQDDEVHRTDIQLVEGRMVVGVHQGVTFIDQAAPAPAHVLVRPSDVVLRTDFHQPAGVLQAILEEDMVDVDLEAIPFAPAVPAHDLSLVHVHAQCHTQVTRDILEAIAVPDQSVGQGEAAAAMTLGIVDLDHPEPDDMVSGQKLVYLSVYSKSKYLRCKRYVYYHYLATVSHLS